MKLIIQIPARNEEKTITQTLADLPKKIDGIHSIETLLIDDGKIDPSFVVTDQARLEEGPALYSKFRDKEDGCIKVVLKP